MTSLSPVVREEFAGKMNGVEGRFFAVTVRGPNYKEGTLTSQRWSATREYTENGCRHRIKVAVRFDDECRNGHNSFAVTAEIDDRHGGRWHEFAAGCCHDDIERVFPELAPLIKWHSMNSDGPTHYLANTIYLAGDRDYRGKRAGEPYAFSEAVQFGDNPIKHKVKRAFWQFLKDAEDHGGSSPFDFEIIEYTEKKTNGLGGDDYYRKYTFGGYAEKWYECPFDTEQEAFEFLNALQTHNPKFVRTPTLFSEGKPRELESARKVANWPDATDEELMQEPEDLKAALEARAPALLKDFRRDIEGAGFLWAPVN